MSTCTPTQLVDAIRKLSRDEAGHFWQTIEAGSISLTEEHATELLRFARTLSEWHKIVAVLNIGDFFFDNEFVDYAIDMLSFPPVNTDPMPLLCRGQDPFAVGLHAANLLITRKSIRRDQYARITLLPDSAPGKRTLLDALRGRVP